MPVIRDGKMDGGATYRPSRIAAGPPLSASARKNEIS
jgi:hypothetical protein